MSILCSLFSFTSLLFLLSLSFSLSASLSLSLTFYLSSPLSISPLHPHHLYHPLSLNSVSFSDYIYFPFSPLSLLSSQSSQYLFLYSLICHCSLCLCIISYSLPLLSTLSFILFMHSLFSIHVLSSLLYRTNLSTLLTTFSIQPPPAPLTPYYLYTPIIQECKVTIGESYKGSYFVLKIKAKKQWNNSQRSHPL